MYTAFALTGLIITLIISAITLYRNKKIIRLPDRPFYGCIAVYISSFIYHLAGIFDPYCRLSSVHQAHNIKADTAAGNPLVVLAFPLILFQLVNFGILEPFTLGISDYLPLPEAREKELGLANIIPNLPSCEHNQEPHPSSSVI